MCHPSNPFEYVIRRNILLSAICFYMSFLAFLSPFLPIWYGCVCPMCAPTRKSLTFPHIFANFMYLITNISKQAFNFTAFISRNLFTISHRPPPAIYRSSSFTFHTIPIHLVSFFDLIIQRHSIHGMMEEENVIRPHQEIQALNFEEKKFLLAVERGEYNLII